MLKFIQNNREATALLAIICLFVFLGALDSQYLRVQTLTMVYGFQQRANFDAVDDWRVDGNAHPQYRCVGGFYNRDVRAIVGDYVKRGLQPA